MSTRLTLQDLGDGVKVNTALRFYHEIMGLDQLHYGMWQADDPFTMQGLKDAQEHYSEHLLAYMPEGVKSVLDVGAGTGATSAKLKGRGFDVEALSPDPYQQYLFQQKRDVTFHLTPFEKYSAKRSYDLVLMSESCQYIPLNLLFAKVKECAAGGYLLIDDYFISNPDSTAMSKSGHLMQAFSDAAKESGFELMQEEDITEQAARSLDLARSWIEDYVLPSIDLVRYSFARKHPLLMRMLTWMARNKVQKFQNGLMLLDSEHFKRVKRYKILLYKVPE